MGEEEGEQDREGPAERAGGERRRDGGRCCSVTGFSHRGAAACVQRRV